MKKRTRMLSLIVMSLAMVLGLLSITVSASASTPIESFTLSLSDTIGEVIVGESMQRDLAGLAAATEGKNFTIQDVKWENGIGTWSMDTTDEVFAAGSYSIEMKLVPNEGYSFTSVNDAVYILEGFDNYSKSYGLDGDMIIRIEYGDAHAHTFADTYSYDRTHHWYAATCAHADLKDGYEEHTLGEDHGCSGCNQYFHDYEWEWDGGRHWANCSCGEQIYPNYHIFDKSGVCTTVECGYVRPELTTPVRSFDIVLSNTDFPIPTAGESAARDVEAIENALNGFHINLYCPDKRAGWYSYRTYMNSSLQDEDATFFANDEYIL